MNTFRIAILLVFSQLSLIGQDLAGPFAQFGADEETVQFPDFRAWELLPPDVRQDYIAKYRRIAIDEMLRAGVPASIKMAQGILESNAGQSKLAKDANNHFGIKCGADWKGKTHFSMDDDRDAAGNAIQSCFRKYRDADDSWVAHSDFLRDPKKYNRYGFLFHLDQKDYRSWAYGLKSAGYATGGGYAESIINLIETNRLYEMDTEALNGGVIAGKPGKPGTTTPLPGRGIGSVNDVKVVLAKKDETLDEVARRMRVKTVKLVDYNDNAYQPTDKLKENTRVFLQKKRKKWRGRQKVAYVKDTQLMIDVAQQYGIRLDKLQKKNRMAPGDEPAPGETIKIRGFWKRTSKPRLRSSDEVTKIENNRPSAGNGATTSTGTKPATGTTTKPADGKPQNPYAEELPFEIGDDRTTTETRPGQPTPVTPPPVERPKPQPTQPPIATTDNDYPGSERAKPTPSTNPAPTNRPPTTTPDPVTRPGSATPSRPSTQPAGGVPGAVYHEVVKGDTLYNISKRYGTTPDALQKLNNLADAGIKIGQNLRVK